MFNFSGSEIIFLLLLALIILGPEKLPEAIRRFAKTYAEFKKVTTGFQSELRSALDEPMREMRETADALRKAAQFDIDLDTDVQPTTPAVSPTKAELDGAAAPDAELGAAPGARTRDGTANAMSHVTPAPGRARPVPGNEPPLAPSGGPPAAPAPGEDGAEPA